MNRTLVYKIALAALAAGIFLAVCMFAYSGYSETALPPVLVALPQEQAPAIVAPRLYQYIEATEGCGPYYGGACVNVRSGPGTDYPVVSHLRIGVVLMVADTVAGGERDWHKLRFDDAVRYPERITGDWYVAAEYVQTFTATGTQDLPEGAHPATSKRILVDRSEQMLRAYDGDTLFMEEPISTGLDLTPTPRGTFTVYRKTPSRYMQGPLPGISEQYYDLPGVPWNLYFTLQGGVIHGAYWHDKFGQPWSHGCVNLPPQKAKELYQWADLGTTVVVRD